MPKITFNCLSGKAVTVHPTMDAFGHATGQAAIVFVDGNLRQVPIPAPVREAIQVFEDMPTAN